MIVEFENLVESKKSSGSAEDFYDIAQLYDSISHFGNPNPFYNNFKRLYFYLKAGNMGYSEAFNNLGFIIEHELNIKDRLNRAKQYYLKAAELGSELGKENFMLSK